jgi:hypothetical protein
MMLIVCCEGLNQTDIGLNAVTCSGAVQSIEDVGIDGDLVKSSSIGGQVFKRSVKMSELDSKQEA